MANRFRLVILIAFVVFLAVKGISGRCSTYQQVSACKTILDGIQSSDSRECAVAENCLKGLYCCCASSLPFPEKIRCSVTRRDIGHDIFRLNYICKRIVVQQPASPSC